MSISNNHHHQLNQCLLDQLSEEYREDCFEYIFDNWCKENPDLDYDNFDMDEEAILEEIEEYKDDIRIQKCAPEDLYMTRWL